MSQQTVELVRRLQPGPDIDLARAFRDDALAQGLLDALAPFVHPGFEAIAKTSMEHVAGTGLQGLREVWLEWLQPWAHYRVEVEDVLDAGDRAVVLARDFGRRKGSDAEVSLTAAGVWYRRSQGFGCFLAAMVAA